MNSEQKDSMLHDILMQVKCRIVYLVSRDMIDESIALYKECTGLTEAKIKEILLPEKDVWLSAKEAVKYKLADKIKSTY